FVQAIRTAGVSNQQDTMRIWQFGVAGAIMMGFAIAKLPADRVTGEPADSGATTNRYRLADNHKWATASCENRWASHRVRVPRWESLHWRATSCRRSRGKRGCRPSRSSADSSAGVTADRKFQPQLRTKP